MGSWTPGPGPSAGNDIFTGDDTDEVASGGAGDDALSGGAGDDSLTGGLGDDVISGGAGNDTAVFGGKWSEYTLNLPAPGGMILSGPEGTDFVYGTERLQFSDATVLVTPPLVQSEFQVSASITGTLDGASVTALGDGGFLAIWMSFAQDGSGFGIFGQRYAASGVPVGAEFQVNTFTIGDQRDPAVAVLSDGGFVVAWVAADQDGSVTGIYGQRFASSGAAVGGEFRINTFVANDQIAPSVTAMSDGGFLVTWDSLGRDGSSFAVAGQRYGVSGNAVGLEFQVNTFILGAQRYSSVAALPDGGFVVVWDSSGQDGSGEGVFGQRYNSVGARVGSEFRVNTFTTDQQQSAAVIALADGGFVVTWSSFDEDGSRWGVYGQRFDAAGAVRGAEFRVNSFVAGNQQNVAIAALADGGFVVTWESNLQDGSSTGVYGQRYDASGLPVEGEFRVNQFTKETQAFPSVAGLADGGFLAVWTSFGPDPSGYHVYGQRYDSNGHPFSSGADLTVIGDNSSQVLGGNSGADSLFGGGGDDMLEGADGNDTLDGGVGNDILDGGIANDTLNGGAGDDILVGGRGGVNVMNGGDGVDSLGLAWQTGAVFVDLAAGAYSYAGGGWDALTSIEGAIGGAGNDTLLGDAGANLLRGGAGIDTLLGRDGADTLLGEAGDDWLDGGLGDDLLEGGVGVNVLIGGDGIDLASYASQTANLWIDMPAGVYSAAGVWDVFFQSIEGVLGGSGNDTIFGNGLDNTLRGAGGDDALIGGVGNDRLEGGAGADWIVGGEGNDRLIGGEGVDVLTGGAGADTFDLGAAAGWDVAFDFNTAEDRFSLGGLSWLGFLTIDADGDGQTDDTLLGYAGGNFVALGVSGLSLTQWNALVDTPVSAATGMEMMADAETAPLAAWADPTSGVGPSFLPDLDPDLGGLSFVPPHETSGWGIVG